MTNAPDKRPAFEPAAQLLKPARFDPDMKRPVSTVAGAVLVLLRVVVGIVWIAAVLSDWPAWLSTLDVSVDDVAASPGVRQLSVTVVLVVVGLFIAIDAVLALFVLRGRNWARVVVMSFSALSIFTSFAQWWADETDIRITNTLLTLGLDILILLALSSRSAAAYARRNERA